MPEIRYYTVTQEREVKVSANSPVEAAQIADAAFKGEIQPDDLVVQYITRPVRDRDLVVREDY
jgi:hypothetical protein